MNPISLLFAAAAARVRRKKEFPAAKLIVYHSYPDFIHYRDPKAGQGHYKPHKPKGIGINKCFTCSKSNLQEVSIEPLVSLVHLCIKFIVTAIVFSTPLGWFPLPDCLLLTTVVYSLQRSIKIHRSEVATPACRTCNVCQSMYEKMEVVTVSSLRRHPSRNMQVAAGNWNMVNKWWKCFNFIQHLPAVDIDRANWCSDIWEADEGLRILFLCLAFFKCQAGLEWWLSPAGRIRNILQQTSTTGPGYTFNQIVWCSWAGF